MVRSIASNSIQDYLNPTTEMKVLELYTSQYHVFSSKMTCTYLTANSLHDDASVMQLCHRSPDNPSVVDGTRLLEGIHEDLLLFWLQVLIASEIFGLIDDVADGCF